MNFKINNKDQLEQFVCDNWEVINSYISKMQEGLPIPFYSSVDIRESREKYAPVDHNMYPAGFNNLCNVDIRGAATLVRETLKKINPQAVTPKYNYPTDSGFDLYSTIDLVLPPFGRALIPTGLKFDIDEGYELQVRTKSGLAINHGLIVLNSPGTVDCGYTGEVQVIVFNTTQTEFTITRGMKVAQGVLSPVVNGRWVQLMEVDEVMDKDRGDNGFGSTGIK